jgi:hypothetical protein
VKNKLGNKEIMALEKTKNKKRLIKALFYSREELWNNKFTFV